MTYRQGPPDPWYGEEPNDDEGPDDQWPEDEWPEDESPYPEGISLKPLIVGVTIVLTLCCWWLAFNSPGFLSGLVFGLVAPICVWCVGLRMARGSSKRAEAEDRARLVWNLDRPLTRLPTPVGRYVLRYEKVQYYSHRHPISLLGRRHPWFGALIVLTWLSLTALMLRLGLPLEAGAMALVMLPVVAFQVLGWRNEWFWVTNFRIFRSHGILKRRVQMVPKTKIEGVSCTTPGMSRLLARLRFIWVPYGHILIETAEEEAKEGGHDEDTRIEEMMYLPGATNVTAVVIEWSQ